MAVVVNRCGGTCKAQGTATHRINARGHAAGGRWAARGTAAEAAGAYFSCTLPLTVAVTVALPASTGSAESAEALIGWARSMAKGWPWL